MSRVPPPSAEKPSPSSHETFLNRDLSWLDFNMRVFEEAADPSNPLLERLKFAAIVASNLDEFFMVRVAGLQHVRRQGDSVPDAAGLRPSEQLTAISARAHTMVDELSRSVREVLLPALDAHGVRLLRVADLDADGRDAVASVFRSDVLPALTPLAIDAARPFPMLTSLSLNVAFLFAPVAGSDEPRMAVVQVPTRMSRLIPVPGHRFTFVPLEDVIVDQVDELFPGQHLLECASFRLSRDSELVLDDEGGHSYVLALEEELRNRRRSDVVRIEIAARASERLLDLLTRQVLVAPEDVYRVPEPLDLRLLVALVDLPGFDELRDPPRPPVPVLSASQERDIFTLLDQRDLLVHHPYESFDPVIAFVDAAADDPDVIAIKHTLYRTSGDSPIVKALIRAADQGKQVTALVELMARFDEQRNIQWARELEDMGAHVIYGVRDYKVHAKICLVVRRTKAGIRRYLHLGTGNYNDRTARIYTDFGLFTSAPAFGADASAFFSTLTGYSDPPRLDKLVMAPTTLRARILKLIRREARRAEAGQTAEIRAKMNSLTDEEIVRALYAASRAGVRIWLNVRGVCTLRPGVPDQSETIEVVSIVGRFLEHARVFVFHNGGDQEVYLASADWMARNLDKRVELMFPVEDVACRRRILAALDTMARDNVKARRLDADGRWRVPPRDPAVAPFDAQMALYEQAVRESLDSAGTSIEPLKRPSR